MTHVIGHPAQYLHGHQLPDAVEGGVGDVDLVRVVAADDLKEHNNSSVFTSLRPLTHQNQDVQRDKVDDEDIATPGRDHVPIRDGCQYSLQEVNLLKFPQFPILIPRRPIQSSPNEPTGSR